MALALWPCRAWLGPVALVVQISLGALIEALAPGLLDLRAECRLVRLLRRAGASPSLAFSASEASFSRTSAFGLPCGPARTGTPCRRARRGTVLPVATPSGKILSHRTRVLFGTIEPLGRGG
jgi:hypothetical protein